MFDVSNFWYTIAGLINTSLWIYFWIVIISVIISWIPLDPYHPTAGAVLRFLRRATEPTFDFFRRTFRLHRYTAPLDVTPLLVLLAISFLRIFLVRTIMALSLIGNPLQFGKYVIINFFLAILYTLSSVLNIYFWIVIIAVIVSWIPLDPYHPLARAILTFLRNVTEPVFNFFRRTFHLHRYTAPLDFTPLIVILLILLLQNVVIRYLMGLVLTLR